MEEKEAGKYPLFKNFEFLTKITIAGGCAMILIPEDSSAEKRVYSPKKYSFSELFVTPYIQKPFNKNEKITLLKIVNEIEDENESWLTQEQYEYGEREEDDIKAPSILRRIMKKFKKHGLINLVDGDLDIDMTETQMLSALISKGENYDFARVYSLEYLEADYRVLSDKKKE